MSSIRREVLPEPLPTIKEELERKTFEQLELLATMLDEGRISQEGFDAGLISVWNCVSGLVGDSITNLIGEMSKQLKKDYSSIDSRCFVKEGAAPVWITRMWGSNKVRVPAGHVREYDHCKAAFEKQNAFSEGLMQSGWTRKV